MLALHLNPQPCPNRRLQTRPPRPRHAVACDSGAGLSAGDKSPAPPPSAALGRIRRLVLTPDGRSKLNPTPDRDFYAFPRFVKHVDEGFLKELTKLYLERIPEGGDVFDLMSSWVSHLPEEVPYRRVVGHGLNAQELARNPRLESFFVKDLNREQELALESCSFDAVVCTVSVQYLQWPEKVFAEVLRVLKPGGVCIISFSDRMFYEKAIAAWRDGTTYSRTQLVVQYFQCVEGFTQPEVIRRLPRQESRSVLQSIASLLGYSRSDPFCAVVAYRNFKPI
ncbi:unnamed protein product [Spirodela intermedia]|uniref:Methyltransferase type 11 domain-containing protein n=1 Tax=Spirodela intermedia TaxID=51605 RepID=A0A7I8KDQ2_SPIIN|nr:unnamed protein product [Spirodela intermedia]